MLGSQLRGNLRVAATMSTASGTEVKPKTESDRTVVQSRPEGSVPNFAAKDPIATPFAVATPAGARPPSGDTKLHRSAVDKAPATRAANGVAAASAVSLSNGHAPKAQRQAVSSISSALDFKTSQCPLNHGTVDARPFPGTTAKRSCQNEGNPALQLPQDRKHRSACFTSIFHARSYWSS